MLPHDRAYLSGELKHWGVLGMHWGVRKAEPQASNPPMWKSSGKRNVDIFGQDRTKVAAFKNQFKKAQYGIDANQHAKEQSRMGMIKKISRRIANTPYRSVNKNQRMSDFDKAMLGVGTGVLGGALLQPLVRPTADYFGKKILAYVMIATAKKTATSILDL